MDVIKELRFRIPQVRPILCRSIFRPALTLEKASGSEEKECREAAEGNRETCFWKYRF